MKHIQRIRKIRLQKLKQWQKRKEQKDEDEWRKLMNPTVESSRVYREHTFDENGTCRIPAPPDGYIMDRLYGNITVSGKSREEIFEKLSNFTVNVE